MEYANTFTTILNSIISSFVGLISSFFDFVAGVIYDILSFSPLVTVAVFSVFIFLFTKACFNFFED